MALNTARRAELLTKLALSALPSNLTAMKKTKVQPGRAHPALAASHPLAPGMTAGPPPKQGGHASMGVGNFNTRGANLAKAQGANANLGSRIAKVPGKLSGGKPSWMNPVAKLPKMNPVAKLPKMLSGPVGANRRGPNDKVSKLGKQPFAPQYDKSVRPARIARSGILPAARKASSALLSGGAGTRNAMKSAFQPPAKRLVKKLKPNPYI